MPQSNLDTIMYSPRYTIMREYKRLVHDARHVYTCACGTPWESGALAILLHAENALDNFMLNPDECIFCLDDPCTGYISPLSDLLARVAGMEHGS